MKRLTLSALAFAALAFVAPAVAAEADDPEAVIRAIYESYPPNQSENPPPAMEDQSFSPSLRQAWDEVQDAADATHEVGVDWDIFIDAQDWDTVHDLATSFAPDGADKGTVTATFTVFEKAQTKTFPMVKTPEGWKIDNVVWGPGPEDNLRAVLIAIRKGQLEPQ